MIDFVFDVATIGPELYKWLRFLIAPGSIILEMGSGRGTGLLCQNYTVYSAEDNSEFIDLYGENYIYAPRVADGWYDADILANSLPEQYDCLLIDGPRGSSCRAVILDHLDLFNLKTPIIFIDDIHRDVELRIFDTITHNTGRRNIIVSEDGTKKFGIIAG